jgi:hypothetical protein
VTAGWGPSADSEVTVPTKEASDAPQFPSDRDQGETLRSILLNAFGWWKVSQITYIASLIAFGLGGLTLLASLFGLTLRHRPEVTHETIPAEGPKTPTA